VLVWYHAVAAPGKGERKNMIEVDPRTRSSLVGFVAIIIGAGWVAYGLLGDGNRVFLTVMLLLTIVLGSGVIFFVRSRASS
jgi:hypothetical protein